MACGCTHESYSHISTIHLLAHSTCTCTITHTVHEHTLAYMLVFLPYFTRYLIFHLTTVVLRYEYPRADRDGVMRRIEAAEGCGRDGRECGASGTR